MLRGRTLTVTLLALVLLGVGFAAGFLVNDRFFNRKPVTPEVQKEPGPQVAINNGEAPQPALAAAKPTPIIEVAAQFPGASAEEVERQVTIPLVVVLGGMPGLESVRSRSTTGRCDIYTYFKSGTDVYAAKQEVINRLQFVQALPPGVNPLVAPGPNGGEVYYVLDAPRDLAGKPIYAPRDLRTLQDWVLDREFRRVPGVMDSTGLGGQVKRYDLQLDVDRMRAYGITLAQVSAALEKNNANVGGDFLERGVALNVRNIGLFGSGEDSLQKVLGLKDPDSNGDRESQRRRLATKAAKILREDEAKRIKELRQIVIAKNNDVDVRLEDVVMGGKALPGQEMGRGVVIGGAPGANTVSVWQAGNTDDQAVLGIIKLRPGEGKDRAETVLKRIEQLNQDADRLLPGVRIVPYYSSLAGDSHNEWIYAQLHSGLDSEKAAAVVANAVKTVSGFPEVERIVSSTGDVDGDGSNQATFFVGLKVKADNGQPRRGRDELRTEINVALQFSSPGVDWLVTAADPVEMGQALPGIAAAHLVSVVGPDLKELSRLAVEVKNAMKTIPGAFDVAVISSDATNLEFRIDLKKCKKWGVSATDVNKVIQAAISQKPASAMIEGERIFDISIRLPFDRTKDRNALLEMPVDIVNNQILGPQNGPAPAPKTGPPPTKLNDTVNPITATPRLLLRDLVSLDSSSGTVGVGAIYRLDGNRIQPIRFSPRGRSVSEIRAEAMKAIEALVKAPYRVEWID